jgi:hypothetical protein
VQTLKKAEISNKKKKKLITAVKLLEEQAKSKISRKKEIIKIRAEETKNTKNQ